MNDIHDPKSKVFPEGVLRHNDITNCSHVDYSDFDLPIKLTEVLPEISIREDIDESIYAHVIRKLGITVDRDELLRALNYERDQYAAGYAAGFKAAQPKWISVNERLPSGIDWVDEYEYEPAEYLVQVGNAELATVAMFDGEKFIPAEYPGIIEERLFANSVTHWMPLPQPPKDEQ